MYDAQKDMNRVFTIIDVGARRSLREASKQEVSLGVTEATPGILYSKYYIDLSSLC
jgi:hypothetical protein